jgi:hypothetical protein
MIHRLTAAAAVLLLASALSLDVLAQQASAERSFDGDVVRLDLSAGNFRITASPDNRIRVMPRTKGDQVSTRISLNLLGTRATVRVVGPKDGFDADIQLPARVGVEVELAAGSLRLSGVEGRKDVTARAADIEVAVGDQTLIRHVSATVDTGEVTAPAFDRSARGVRSFQWTGRGARDLRVRVAKGRITLEP